MAFMKAMKTAMKGGKKSKIARKQAGAWYGLQHLSQNPLALTARRAHTRGRLPEAS